MRGEAQLPRQQKCLVGISQVRQVWQISWVISAWSKATQEEGVLWGEGLGVLPTKNWGAKTAPQIVNFFSPCLPIIAGGSCVAPTQGASRLGPWLAGGLCRLMRLEEIAHLLDRLRLDIL